MADLELIYTQLSALQEKLQLSSKKKVSEKEWQNLFHEVCTAFRQATPEQRVDIQVAFEDRHALLAVFTQYMTRMAQSASQTASRGNDANAIKLLQEGIIADAIIDGRINQNDIQNAQDQLVASAEKLRFDMAGYLKQFETPPNTYVMHAYQLHKAHKQKQAMQVLGRAMQLNPALQKNEKIAQFAAELTGQPTRNAIMTLEDSFLRNRFIEEWENPPQEPRVKNQAHLKDYKPPGRKLPIVDIILIIFGTSLFFAASFWWHQQCRRLFGSLPPGKDSFMYWFDLFLGICFIVGGLIAVYKQEIRIQYRFSYSADPITFSYAGLSATVLGVGFLTTGVVFLGTGINGHDWLQSFGALETIFSRTYGLILGIGMGLIALVVGFVMKIFG